MKHLPLDTEIKSWKYINQIEDIKLKKLTIFVSTPNIRYGVNLILELELSINFRIGNAYLKKMEL